MSEQSGKDWNADRQGIFSRGWITFFGALVGAGLVFGNEILVARHLGVPLYGLYALALVIARIAETVSLFGMRSGLMHFLPVFLDQGQMNKAAGSILAAVLLPLGLGIASLGVVWLGAPWIAGTVLNEPASVPYLRIFALPIPLMCMVELLGVVTRGFGRAELYVVIRNLTPPVSYMLLLLLLIATGGRPVLVGGAFGVAQLVAAAVGATIVIRLMRARSAWTRPEFDYRELYRYSMPIMFNTLLYSMMAASDILMLANLRGATDAGIYRACVQFRPAFDMALLAFNAAAIHLYPVYHRDGRRAELDRDYGTVIRMTSVITAILFVLVVLSRRDILGLLGPEFPAGATAMLFLLISFLFQGCLGSAGMLLVVTGHQHQETISAAVGVLINVVLNFFLIPRLGVSGAGVATVFAMLVVNLLRTWFVKRHIGIATIRRDVFVALAIGGVVLAVTYLVAQGLDIGDGAGLLAMILRSALAAGLLLLGFWGYSRKAGA